MQTRSFGRLGWPVSEIGYGMWGLAGWTGSDEEEVRQALQRAVELGINFFDTAWAYGEGKSERMLGELVRANPDKKLWTASKIPAKNFKWPARAEYTLDETYPPRPHPPLYRVEPREPGIGVARPDAVSRLA